MALAWVMQRPGVTSTLMGASKVEQVHDNLEATRLTLPAAALAELDQASAPTRKMLYSLFTPPVRRQAVFGGHTVRAWGD